MRGVALLLWAPRRHAELLRGRRARSAGPTRLRMRGSVRQSYQIGGHRGSGLVGVTVRNLAQLYPHRPWRMLPRRKRTAWAASHLLVMQDFDGTCPGHPLGVTRAGDIDSGEIYSSIASHHDWFHHDGPHARRGGGLWLLVLARSDAQARRRTLSYLRACRLIRAAASVRAQHLLLAPNSGVYGCSDCSCCDVPCQAGLVCRALTCPVARGVSASLLSRVP